MQFIVEIFLSIAFSSLFGFAIYVFALYALSEDQNDKFKKYVPLYPKPKYAVMIYVLSGFLYYAISYIFTGGFSIEKLFILNSPLCVIGSSFVVNKIAQWRMENIEETIDEEMERKQKGKYDY